MTATCHPLPQSIAQEMLQVAARALCDRPGDNPAQRDGRTRQMVHSTLGFEPRDGLEYMLSTLVFGHFSLILDSMHEVFQGQLDTMKMRTKTTIVALDRSMLALVREWREARKRSPANSAEDARRASVAEAPSPAMPPEASVPPPLPARATAAAVAPPVISRPDAVPEATAKSGQPGIPPASPGPTHADSPRTKDRVSDPGASTRPPAPLAEVQRGQVAHHPAPRLSREEDEDTIETHIADFEAALATAAETLAEMRALDDAKAEAKAASGD